MELALESMIPQLDWLGSPRPRKARAASEMMAALATRTNWADASGVSRVRMWRPTTPGARGAHGPGRLHVLVLAHLEHLGPQDPRRAGPADTAAMTSAVVTRPRPKKAASTSTSGQEGEGQGHVGEAHEHGLDPPPPPAGDDGDQQADGQGQDGGAQADGQGDAGAVDELAEDVDAEVVGAEGVAEARAGSSGRPLGRLGEWRATSGAKTAASAGTASSTSPGPARASSPGLFFMSPPSRAADPRVEERVDELGHQVGGDHAGGDEQEGALQHGVVPAEHALVDEPAETGVGEHRLDGGGAAEQGAHVQHGHRPHRDEGVATGVAAHAGRRPGPWPRPW